MSSEGAQIAVLGMRGQRVPAEFSGVSARPQAIRLIAFAALGAYGTLRWSKLLTGPSHGSLMGVLGLALVLVAARPVLARRSRVLARAFTVVMLVAAFPVAGLPLQWVLHVRLAVSARAIGHGLSALPQALVPYMGTDRWVRLDIVLGGAVLLFDAALLLAFAPRRMDDLRRAGAALPLIALVAVPATLVHPRFPYLNGLLFFLMLAAFTLGDRIISRRTASAFGLCLATAITAMLVAPALDRHQPWLDYEALAGKLAPRVPDTFNWTQSYGPVDWPQRGRTVLEIRASHPEYWKAEGLDVFDVRAWTQGEVPGQERVPPPAPSSLAAWTQTIQVGVRDMRTGEVIGAGISSHPDQVSQPVGTGFSQGTWTAGNELSSGEHYMLSVYTPQPSAAQLNGAGSDYVGLPEGYRTLLIPSPTTPATSASVQLVFPVFHRRGTVRNVMGVGLGASLIRASVYGPAYRLAQRLARGARTPYGFVRAVESFLAHGYAYTEDPPIRAYPLESFLFADKRGYCQQFAGAMALLLRMGGVPARVGVGFTPGHQDPLSHRWLVTDNDAHAWVEVWFPRFGWVTFDPTPPVDPALSGLSSSGTAAMSASVGSPSQHSRRLAGTTSSKPRAANGYRGRTQSDAAMWVALAGSAAVVLGAFWLLWLATRPVSLSAELVEELDRALARTGRPLSDGATLSMLEAGMRGSPGASEYIRVLRLARFGGSEKLPTPAQRRALRRQLAAGRGPLRRLQTLWALPPRRWGRRAVPTDVQSGA